MRALPRRVDENPRIGDVERAVRADSTVSTRVAVAAAGCCGLRPQETARVASPSPRTRRGWMCIEAGGVTATLPPGWDQLVKARARGPRTLGTPAPRGPEGAPVPTTS